MPSAKDANATTTGNGANSSSSSSSNKNDNAAKGAGSQGGTGVGKNFAESYGLKMYEPGEYEEAQAIQQAFRDQDAKQGEMSEG